MSNVSRDMDRRYRAGMTVAAGGPPAEPPLGLLLAQTAKAVSRAFDDALAAVGGSTPTWLVLLNVKIQAAANQRTLAESVGIRGATLSHHLDNLEAQGLVRRVADPENRRVQRVELTASGEAAFKQLRTAAIAFDRQLQQGLSDRERAGIRKLLAKLQTSAGGER